MKVLLFGSSGQVGSECRRVFASNGWDVLALTRNDADFCKPEDIYSVIKKIKPDVVVNACAYTAVDKAETESDIAKLVNGDSVGSIGKACSELKIPTIHISTDYVFNGRSSSPYKETDLVAPMGVYGESKLSGEHQLQIENPKHIILRTSWVFSKHGNNFVKTMLRVGAERNELRVVSDQFGCPTYAADIAETISAVITTLENELHFSGWGLYHCSNVGECSWHEFAEAIFVIAVDTGLLDKAPKVNSITTDQYPTPTVRPAYSVLDCSKLETLLGESMPSWKIGLVQVCNALR
jgi:dTDP-4-dehydrorhamnose reductase